MSDLPLCVRCGHPFERHRGWNQCVGCSCPGYSSVVPVDRASTRIGDRLELVSIAGGVVYERRVGAVAELDDEGLVLDIAGERTRVSWERARVGGVRRVA